MYLGLYVHYIFQLNKRIMCLVREIAHICDHGLVVEIDRCEAAEARDYVCGEEGRIYRYYRALMSCPNCAWIRWMRQARRGQYQRSDHGRCGPDT